jgi:hypothetical protein
MNSREEEQIHVDLLDVEMQHLLLVFNVGRNIGGGRRVK